MHELQARLEKGSGKLNLPSITCLDNGKRVLIAGGGGGFDVYAGIPIAWELEKQGKLVKFANYSSEQKGFDVRKSTEDDYPEYMMCKDMYTLGREGVQIVKKGYEKIIDEHKIDTVILVDGGVDSLMRGDEEGAGTIFEDFISLSAVDALEGVEKLLVCLGFGVETEENLCHHHVLRNIATQAKNGSFYGSCSLTSDMEGFQEYKENCLNAWKFNRKSHVHTKIIPAVEGEFGNHHMYDEIDPKLLVKESDEYFISPLMSIYWFFNLEGVVKENLLVKHLKNSSTFTDALMMFRQALPQLKKKSRKAIQI